MLHEYLMDVQQSYVDRQVAEKVNMDREMKYRAE